MQRSILKLVSFAALVLLLTPLAPAFGEEEVERVKGHNWLFWYQDRGNLYDQAYASKKECESEAKGWNQSSPSSPIAFPCAKVTESLARSARRRCKRNEPLACAWEKKIETFLGEDEDEERE